MRLGPADPSPADLRPWQRCQVCAILVFGDDAKPGVGVKTGYLGSRCAAGRQFRHFSREKTGSLGGCETGAGDRNDRAVKPRVSPPVFLPGRTRTSPNVAVSLKVMTQTVPGLPEAVASERVDPIHVPCRDKPRSVSTLSPGLKVRLCKCILCRDSRRSPASSPPCRYQIP